MPLLLRMAVCIRVRTPGLWHTLGLWLFGWVARSEGVQTIASLGAIGPMRRLVALVLVLLLAMGEDPRRSATRLHASKQALV